MSSTPVTLSLCMIVKNEAFFIERCLQLAAPHVDEIIVVDTGSTDATKALAAPFAHQLLDYAWQDDFAAARNFAIDHASGDWIVVLDADEVIEPQHWQALRELAANTPRDAFFLTQRNYSVEPLERNWVPIAGKTPYTRHYRGYRPNPIARLFRNRPDIRYRGRVHEVIDESLATGSFEVLDIPIHHHMDEDPSKMKADRQLNYLRIIEQGLDQETDGRLLTAAGTICLYHTDDLQRGIGYLRRAVAQGFQPDDNSEYIAEAQYRLGQLDEAYAGYRALYDKGYRSLNSSNNLANLAVRRGEHAFAAEVLEAAVARGVPDPQLRIRMEHNIRYLRGQGEG